MLNRMYCSGISHMTQNREILPNPILLRRNNMYVSRKKRSLPLPEPVVQSPVYAPQSTDSAADANTEALASEISPEAEPLEIGRDLFLEPEDEPWDTEAEGDPQISSDADAEEGGEDVSVPDDPQDLDNGEMHSDSLTYEQFLAENTGEGVLRVQTSAGGQSIPLPDVRITVYRDLADGRHIFYTVTTDPNGVADGMILPAPPRENSIEGNGASPFASYSVSAGRDGLSPAAVENVPIFAGVKSIQPITLAPSEGEV